MLFLPNFLTRSKLANVLIAAAIFVVALTLAVGCVWLVGPGERTVSGTPTANSQEVREYKAEEAAKQIQEGNLVDAIVGLIGMLDPYPFSLVVEHPSESPEENLKRFRDGYCQALDEFGADPLEIMSIENAAQFDFKTLKMRSQLPADIGDFATEVAKWHCS